MKTPKLNMMKLAVIAFAACVLLSVLVTIAMIVG